MAVVRPGAELHGAVLAVKGKEGDVHGAGGFVAGRWRPGDHAVKLDDGFGHQGALEPTVSTEGTWNKKLFSTFCGVFTENVLTD